jgi:hypothetical protein
MPIAEEWCVLRDEGRKAKKLDTIKTIAVKLRDAAMILRSIPTCLGARWTQEEGQEVLNAIRAIEKNLNGVKIQTLCRFEPYTDFTGIGPIERDVLIKAQDLKNYIAGRALPSAYLIPEEMKVYEYVMACFGTDPIRVTKEGMLLNQMSDPSF